MSDHTVLIIQARMTSTRLPGKVALPLNDTPILHHVLERGRAIPGVDEICVAIPEGAAHDPIIELVDDYPDVTITRGPETNVLRRFALAAETTKADMVVRITSDCPMFDPIVSGAVIELARTNSTALARTAPGRGYPHGYDTEVFSTELLRIADQEATTDFEREHVTTFFWDRPERFPALFLDRIPDRRDWRVTVDTLEDYQVAETLFHRLAPINPLFGIDELENLLLSDVELAKTVIQNGSKA